MLNVIKKYNQKHKEKVGFKAAKIRNPIFVSQIVDKPNCLSHSNMYKIARSGKIFRNIFRKKYLSKISTTLDTLKAFLKIIYSESIDTPDYFIDKFYDNANEDSLKCISVHVPQTKNEFRNSEGLTDITYELIVHLATIPANHETNKEYQKELTKLIRFRGVCDNYPLEQRDLEFKVLESHLLTYIGKSNLISYDFT
ncbi:MAG TPA: hypothetical protein P5275_19130 [Saprospiraceae bacterium]|nr:hypothetical protein [Saprospiraceae bacterium]